MPKVLQETPASLGYFFPPEWHTHRATWLSWPRRDGVSFPGKYETVPPTLAAIIREIAQRERVEINVPDDSHEQMVRSQLEENGCPLTNIFFHHIRTNECWCRDHGPAFLLKPNRSGRREMAVVDWIFNSWGGKYPFFKEDDAVPTHVARELALPVFKPQIVMEGGAVDFNGEGTILTTESCLLNPNRNPGLSRQQIEQAMKDYYGQRHVVWLGQGIAGDDTDGHIDDLARFIDARTIVVAVEQDPRDANYPILQDALQRLRSARDPEGRPFDILELPMPGVVEHKGQRLPATYMNFYFVNGGLLVPTYRNRQRDARALRILQERLPRRRVIGIDCKELIWGLGAIHCLTQQQPQP